MLDVNMNVHLFATLDTLLVLRKAGVIGNTKSNFTKIRDCAFPTIGNEYHLNSINILFLTVAVLPNHAYCVTTQNRYNTSSKYLSAHF